MTCDQVLAIAEQCNDAERTHWSTMRSTTHDVPEQKRSCDASGSEEEGGGQHEQTCDAESAKPPGDVTPTSDVALSL